MSDGKIVSISAEVVRPVINTRYDELDDLLKAIKDLIYQHVGQVPVATVLGVLRIIEHDMIRDCRDE